MKTVDLNNLNGIPIKFSKRLEKFNSDFLNNNFLEHVLSNSYITELIEDINDYCLQNEIFGYHYTKAIPKDILDSGLICRNGDDIRNSFVKDFGFKFTKEELNNIRKIWLSHFDEQEKESRDNLLFFNFTTTALENSSANSLLSYYGGEQIYMPIQELKGIGSKIKKIGKPLILKCKLDPKKIKTFNELPWGKIAVSTYHCKINKGAYQVDQDGYQSINVDPKNIEIIEYNKALK